MNASIHSPRLHGRLGALTLGLAVALAAFAPGVAQAKKCRDITMPNSAQVGGQSLVLNGMGVREATVFNVDVYVAGLYLPERSRDGAAIMANLSTAKLVLKLVRDVSRQEMTEAFTKSFRDSAGRDYSRLSGKMRQLMALVPDVHEGDEFSLIFADGKVTLEVNGRRLGAVDGMDFARPFLGIWIGNDPPNRGLKRGLLGGAC